MQVEHVHLMTDRGVLARATVSSFNRSGCGGTWPLMRLLLDDDAGVGLNPLDITDRSPSDRRPVFAEISEEFRKHFLGGDDLRGSQCAAHPDRVGVPLVVRARQGDPVHRVGEDTPHGAGRFGMPWM